MSYKTFKRLFDVATASVMLLLLTPLFFVICMVCVFLHGWNNIFFLQQRVGLGGGLFRVLQFKTMTDACGRDGPLLPYDQR